MKLSLVEAITALVRVVPVTVAKHIAEAIEGMQADDWSAIRLQAQSASPSAARPAIERLIGTWQQQHLEIGPSRIALAIEAAADAVYEERQAHIAEIVWTGPDTFVPLRRTEQAFLQVVDEAYATLLIVSYVVHAVPNVVQALRAAAERGVRIDCVVGSPRINAVHQLRASLAALRPISQHVHFWYWPSALVIGVAGPRGVLHVKCAVADAHSLFISSANLTRSAMRHNMEMGLLVHDRGLAQSVTDHFAALQDTGVLQPVSES